MRRPMLGMNLQMFAEDVDPETDDSLITDVDTDDDQTTSSEEDEQVVSDTQDDPEDDTPSKSTPELDDNTSWVKNRLARAERSFERKFLEEAASQSDGVQLERQELPKAVRLWNILKHNPDVSRLVDEVLNKAGEEGKLKHLSQVRPDAKISRMEADFDLREAELELKYSDPVYKKYSEKIKDWAEEEGLDVTNPKSLRLAVKAWKADNAALLLAEKTKSKPKTTVTDPKRKSAALVGGKSPVKGTIVDYRKASDSDILKSMGLSLFTDE